jgi:hypothetical protein
MTMQVGMVGINGIVLASDTLWMKNDPTGVRHSSNSSKLKIDYERKVAISCARSMEVALQIAQDLIAELTDEEWACPPNAATRIADRVLSRANNERKIFQCLILAAEPMPQLFHLHYGVYDPAIQSGAWCNRESRAVYCWGPNEFGVLLG